MKFRRKFGLPALLTGAIFTATAAQASNLSEADKARSTMRRVISCAVFDNIALDHGDGVRAVMEGKFEGKAYSRLYGHIESCVWQRSHDGRWVERLGFIPALLKGEVFRSIVLDGWGTRERKDLFPEFQRLANLPRNPSNNPIGAFGVCAVALDPQNARKALDASTADSDEAAAYAALASSMSQCIAPGQSIAFSKQVLEDALAEGLFVLTYGTPVKGALREAAE